MKITKEYQKDTLGWTIHVPIETYWWRHCDLSITLSIEVWPANIVKKKCVIHKCASVSMEIKIEGIL